MTYEKYSEMRNSLGLKDAQICKKTGIAPATISDWKRGKSTPKEDKLRLISTALGMTYSEFIGESVAPVQHYEFDSFEMDLIKGFNEADPETQKVIMNLLSYSKKMKQEQEGN